MILKNNEMISVVIAAYKVNLLKESIESVLNQSYKNFELIIINDCSPDNIKECVDTFSDSRIRYYELNKNAGQSYVRNLGAGLAKGKYIAFQDDDDCWDREKLHKQIGKIDNGKYDFCFSAFDREGERWPDEEVDIDNLYKNILRKPLMTSATILCKKQVFMEVGGFDPGMRNIEDYALSLKLSKQYKGTYINEILLHQGICGKHVSGNDNCNEALRIRCLLFREYWRDIKCFGFVDEWLSGLKRFRPYCEEFVYNYELDKLQEFYENVNKENRFISSNNRKIVTDLFKEIIEAGIDFKLNTKVLKEKPTHKAEFCISKEGISNEDLMNIYLEKVLPSCVNFGSTGFMGFPDAGNSVSGLLGALLSDFIQQNLINQKYCAPVATLMEIEVINTLRKLTGYKVNLNPTNIQEVGGIITYGGTGSNLTAMLLAREQFQSNIEDKTLKNDYYVVIPKGIGHYSIGSSLKWLGSGCLLEIGTNQYRYDMDELKKTLIQYKGKIAAVVAYAGDSRTMTIEHLEAVAKLVKSVDENIWCHADACHGFSLLFSEKLKYKMKGIELFDSMSCDPHKVLALPYCCSAFLLKDPEKFYLISSESDLIMNEPFAFGKITPFIGSKSWVSLKLWSVMKSFGISGIGKMIEKRKRMADIFATKLEKTGEFTIINEVDYNSVVFIWNKGISEDDVERINIVNQRIYHKMKDEGDVYFHQFPIKNLFHTAKCGETYYVLRYMSGNDNLTEEDISKYIEYICKLAKGCNEEYNQEITNKSM